MPFSVGCSSLAESGCDRPLLLRTADICLRMSYHRAALWSGSPSGWQVLKESTGGLIDEAVPDATLARIRQIISEHAEGALEAHDIRTRHAGRMTFIEFHLVVPGEVPVNQTHDICDRIEAALRGHDEHSWITIHVEPESKAKHSGVLTRPLEAKRQLSRRF